MQYLFCIVYLLYICTVGDTASNLGTAMDELMRHQPLLKSSVMIALVRVREGGREKVREIECSIVFVN